MPRLADTTVRLLGQEPLAGRLPTAEQLRIAEILDRAGFAYLEVSGGGCFESAVRRGVESPWERIRSLKARVNTPLGLALRGRFLVGSRPVDDDFIRRFISSAAANGIDVFRLHDPLNDVSNLREAADAVAQAGGEFEAGLVYSPGRTGETYPLMEQARELPNLGAARILLHDPTGSLQPHRARELVTGLRETTKLPVGIYCQGSGGNALAAALEAARAGAELIACAVFPIALTLHRVSGEIRRRRGAGSARSGTPHRRSTPRRRAPPRAPRRARCRRSPGSRSRREAWSSRAARSRARGLDAAGASRSDRAGGCAPRRDSATRAPAPSADRSRPCGRGCRRAPPRTRRPPVRPRRQLRASWRRR